LLDNLRHSVSPNLFEKYAKLTTISERECLQNTGLTKDQFSTLLNDLKSLKNSPQRTKTQALTTYLFWLKTGLSYRSIATLLSIDDFQNVGNYCTQVRVSLLKDFVQKNLGPSHVAG
jgi:hypothetical protein